MKRLLCLILCVLLMTAVLSGCKKQETPSSGMEFPSMPDGAPSLAETYQEALARYDGLVALAEQNGWGENKTVQEELTSIKASLDTVASVLDQNGGNHGGAQQTAMAIFLRNTVKSLLDRVEQTISVPAVSSGE